MIPQPPQGSSGYQVVDRYSARANPRRGYHDYEVTITFWNKSQEYQKNLLAKLYADLQVGYMWCHKPELISPDTWVINHGYDSGD